MNVNQNTCTMCDAEYEVVPADESMIPLFCPFCGSDTLPEIEDVEDSDDFE